MATINGFQDLVGWQKSMDLVACIYQVTRFLPPDERFGLTQQLRRAAVSIPSNIAEGYGRRTRADYVRFLDIARGTANEVQTQLLLAERLGFLKQGQNIEALELTMEVQRILKGLVDSLEKSEKVTVRG